MGPRPAHTAAANPTTPRRRAPGDRHSARSAATSGAARIAGRSLVAVARPSATPAVATRRSAAAKSVIVRSSAGSASSRRMARPPCARRSAVIHHHCRRAFSAGCTRIARAAAASSSTAISAPKARVYASKLSPATKLGSRISGTMATGYSSGTSVYGRCQRPSSAGARAKEAGVSCPRLVSRAWSYGRPRMAFATAK